MLVFCDWCNFATMCFWGTTMGKRPSADSRPAGEIPICRNQRAFHEYQIFDRMECGIVLVGTEVKSLRENGGSLDDAYARLEDGEVWLIGCEIPEYALGHHLNHKPKRRRKLLLRRREIAKFVAKAAQRGFTLVPLRMYFKHGLVKVELAVARGKRLHDKRQALKEADARKEIRRGMSRRPR
jgi:SsrA-binding protein